MEILTIVKEKRLKAVKTNTDFTTGNIVLFICCKTESTPTKYTIQIEPGYHILDPIVKEINHSLDPNVRLDGHSLVAIRPIRKGDEIKRNYYETEEVIIESFIDRETKEAVNTQNLYSFRNGTEEILFDYN